MTVGLFTIVLLLQHANVFAVTRFVFFTAVVVTLPGFALWRLIGNYGRNLVEDIAAGFAVGTAVQIIVYLASASIGLQAWSWVWAPVALVIAFIDRDVRARVWRRVETPVRPLQAWLLALGTMTVALITFRRGPGAFLPAYTDPLRSYPDLAFQQALAASAKYDVPVEALWLGGEPMKYHTFFHQSAAATAWGTRIDLTDLIHSLTWLPLFLAGCGLIFALTTRFAPTAETGATWAGPLAVLVAGLGGVVQPFETVGLSAISTAATAYMNPTQNLGILMIVAISIVAVDLLRSESPRSRWVLLVLFVLIAAGAKSTVLPLVGLGFAFAFVHLGMVRQQTRTAMLGGLLTFGVFLAALLAIFGGNTWGTVVKPFHTFVQLAPYATIQSSPNAQLLSALTMLLSWALAVGGMWFLGRKWRDVGVAFLMGCAVAGLLATLLTTQASNSQLYFVRTGFPLAAVLASVGLANLVGRLGDRRGVALVGAAGLLGLIGFAIARSQTADTAGIKSAWVWTLAAVVVVGVLVSLAWKGFRRPGHVGVAFVAAAVTAGMVGATLVPLQTIYSDEAIRGIFPKPLSGGATTAEADAARWLRENSNPDDLVATNAHCIVQRDGMCDSRHFWIAALSERRVLLEGWAYTSQANRTALINNANPVQVPYWNREVMVANDAAFKAPSEAAMQRLRSANVRWLFADRRAGEISPLLKDFVSIRHATLDVTIYELK